VVTSVAAPVDMLLDTNVISALRLRHRHGPAFERWARDLDFGHSWVSVLTWMELLAGVLSKARTDPAQASVFERWRDDMREVFDLRTLPVGETAAELSAPLVLLRTRGLVDTLIAGTALAHGMTLVTRNVRDFADIPGLTVVNPWAE